MLLKHLQGSTIERRERLNTAWLLAKIGDTTVRSFALECKNFKKWRLFDNNYYPYRQQAIDVLQLLAKLQKKFR
jgi:hypothetical protein